MPIIGPPLITTISLSLVSPPHFFNDVGEVGVPIRTIRLRGVVTTVTAYGDDPLDKRFSVLERLVDGY